MPEKLALSVGQFARSGSVLNTQRLQANDDEEAQAIARHLVDGHAVELWQGLRFIEHFKPLLQGS